MQGRQAHLARLREPGAQPRHRAPRLAAHRVVGLIGAAALAIGLTASRSASACRVEGTPARLGLRVPIGGRSEPVRLVLYERKVAATLVGAGARVEAAAPLALRGDAEVVVRPRGVTPVAGGLLLLAPTSPMVVKRVRGDEVTVTARLSPWSSEGVRAQVVVPCDSLTLDAAPPWPEDPGPQPSGWGPAGTRLTLRARPGGGPRVELTVDSRVSLRLVVEEQRGGWARVSRRFADGSSLSGWVRAPSLRADPSSAIQRYAPPLHGRCHTTPGPPPPGARRLSTALPLGTPLFAARGGGRFAAVATDEPLLLLDEGDPLWVRVERVPDVSDAGACDSLHGAFVERRAVPPQPGGGAAPR